MSAPVRLPRTFYDRPTLVVARELLGQRLVRLSPDGVRLEGLVTECEAYVGSDDLGCHARSGRTARNETMWGSPGHAYVYFTYGMHWMFNVVTESEGYPAAVLIRALHPTRGLELMRRLRPGRKDVELTDGPAKLCQAMGIDGSMSGLDLCSASADLFLESGYDIPESLVITGPRVGLNSVPEPWKSIAWRFQVDRNETRLIVEQGVMR